MKDKLLYYENLNFLPEVIDLMKNSFDVISLKNPSFDKKEVLETINILLAPRDFYIDSKKIDLCSSLKIIASPTLSIPHVDVDYAKEKKIIIIHLGNEKEFLKSITATAELTWGLIFALIRHIPKAHQSVLSGEWYGRKFGEMTPKMLSNMTMGIVGLGRLGSMVASYSVGFGMKVYYYSPNSSNKNYHKCRNLSELANYADIVSVHANHLPETENIVDEKFFHEMKKDSFLINTSRGELIDEAALLNALNSNKIAGAALDVLSGEFTSDFKNKLHMNKLIQYSQKNDNLIITPHYAGATRSAWKKTQTELITLIMNEYKRK